MTGPGRVADAPSLLEADALPVALFLLSGRRIVVTANAVGHNLATDDGPIAIKRQRLVARSPEMRRLFGRLFLNPRPSDTAVCGGWTVYLSRVPADPLDTLGHTRRWTLLRITGPQVDSITRRLILRNRFEATTAEAAVADLIAQGWRVERIAVELGRSASTIRTHLKRVFAKTGARNQRRLAAMVAAMICRTSDASTRPPP